MKAITLLQPQKIVFGTGCIQTFVEDYEKMGLKRLYSIHSLGDILKGTSLYMVQNLHLLWVQPCVISKSGHVGQYGFLYTVPVKCITHHLRFL